MLCNKASVRCSVLYTKLHKKNPAFISRTCKRDWPVALCSWQHNVGRADVGEYPDGRAAAVPAWLLVRQVCVVSIFHLWSIIWNHYPNTVFPRIIALGAFIFFFFGSQGGHLIEGGRLFERGEGRGAALNITTQIFSTVKSRFRFHTVVIMLVMGQISGGLVFGLVHG